MENDSDDSQPKEGTEQVQLIARLEWAVAILLSAVALVLFVVRATHAGALWRDEAESVQSAQMPLPEMIDAVQYSSFPILFPLAVRTWTSALGAGDASLRGFGVAVGISLLAASWLAVRKLTGSAPLLLLAVIGLNANFLIAGMSLRGYGLGSLMMLLAFVSTVRLLLSPTSLMLAAVLVADLACLQCLFFNLALMLSIAAAATCVLLLRRDVRSIWLLTAVVIICVLSYVFYASQFYSSGRIWAKILQVPVSFQLVCQSLFRAWGDISPTISCIWLATICVAMIFGVWRLAAFWRNNRSHERDLFFFGILLIPLSMIASYVFVRFLPRPPDLRYFLALTIVVVGTVDLVWAYFPIWLRAVRVGLVLAATVALPFSFWGMVIQAESNSETVARAVEQNGTPADLVVVNPWNYGVSFNWYYHAATRWICVPEIDDHRVHRYDLLLKKMESAAPLADLEDKIAATLKSGNHVLLVGYVELPSPGEKQLQLSPAPDPKFGWQGYPYRQAWSQEIGLFLSQHVKRATQADLRTPQIVSDRETMFLYLLEGWKN